MMTTIVLNSKNVAKINTLVNLCPDTFVYAPFKIFKDEMGNSFASIETTDVNNSIVFSGKVNLDNIVELNASEGTVIRLPLYNSVINTLFNPVFDTVDINSNKIIAKNDSKKITIALYEMVNTDDSIIDLPYTNNEMFDLTVECKNLGNVEYEQFDLDNEEIKNILESLNVLVKPENILFNCTGKNINISAGDYSGNEVEYKLNDKNISKKFSSKFNMTMMLKILPKIAKAKDFSINMLLCKYLAAITLKNDDVIATIGIPVAQDS